MPSKFWAISAQANGVQTVEIESSEDELASPATTGPIPVAKQKIKARGTIQDKWAAMNLPATKTQDTDEENKPRAPPRPRSQVLPHCLSGSPHDN